MSTAATITAAVQLIIAVQLLQWIAVAEKALQKSLFVILIFDKRMMQWSVSHPLTLLTSAASLQKGNRRYRGTFLQLRFNAMARNKKTYNNDTKALRRARQMPRLRHTLPGEEYADAKSEVLLWLAAQPALVDAIFTFVKARRAIVFDKADSTWRGVDTA